MKTSFTLLPAINSLYDLGLSDEQIQDLKTQSDHIDAIFLKIKESDKKYKLLRNNFDNLKNGLSYILRTKTMFVEINPFSSDGSNTKIELHKISEETREGIFAPSLLTLKENDTAFIYNYERHHSRKITAFLTFSEATCTALNQFFVLDEYINVKEMGATSQTIKTTFYTAPYETAANFQKSVTNYLPALLEINNSISIKGVSDDDMDTFVAAISKSIPGDYTQYKSINDMKDTVSEYDSVYGVASVWEHDNTRVAYLVSQYSFRYWGGTSHLIKADYTHPAYNYLDAGRYTAFHVGGPRDAQEQREFGTIIFSDMPPVLPQKRVLQSALSDMFRDSQPDNAFALVNNATLRLITKRHDQRQNRKDKEDKAKEVLKEKISKKVAILNKLDDPKAELKINNVIFRPRSISYEGQVLSFDSDTAWVYDIVDSLNYSWKFDDINFEMAFDEFLNKAQYRHQGKIGDVAFNIEKRTNINRLGVESTLTYINGFRINSAELEECLRRGLCYTEQADFDFFLKTVSSCSLDLHRYLQHGIDLNLYDSFENVSIEAKLPLERTKNINYLVLSDNEYRVRNSNKLIRLEHQQDLLGAITVLLDPEVVVGIQPEDIKELIADAKTAYVTAVEKSKLLLKETEELFKIKQETVTLGDGKTKFGYVINGKLRKYFIELHQGDIDRSSCGVHDYNTGQYICIVDKSSTTQVGMDKLVNRIFALHNDSMLATEIYTLNKG